eukprot:358299-Chlamydomonas_euryale.AAC.7
MSHCWCYSPGRGGVRTRATAAAAADQFAAAAAAAAPAAAEVAPAAAAAAAAAAARGLAKTSRELPSMLRPPCCPVGDAATVPRHAAAAAVLASAAALALAAESTTGRVPDARENLLAKRGGLQARETETGGSAPAKHTRSCDVRWIWCY